MKYKKKESVRKAREMTKESFFSEIIKLFKPHNWITRTRQLLQDNGKHVILITKLMLKVEIRCVVKWVANKV